MVAEEKANASLTMLQAATRYPGSANGWRRGASNYGGGTKRRQWANGLCVVKRNLSRENNRQKDAVGLLGFSELRVCNTAAAQSPSLAFQAWMGFKRVEQSKRSEETCGMQVARERLRWLSKYSESRMFISKRIRMRSRQILREEEELRLTREDCSGVTASGHWSSSAGERGDVGQHCPLAWQVLSVECHWNSFVRSLAE